MFGWSPCLFCLLRLSVPLSFFPQASVPCYPHSPIGSSPTPPWRGHLPCCFAHHRLIHPHPLPCRILDGLRHVLRLAHSATVLTSQRFRQRWHRTLSPTTLPTFVHRPVVRVRACRCASALVRPTARRLSNPGIPRAVSPTLAHIPRPASSILVQTPPSPTALTYRRLTIHPRPPI